MPTESNVNLTFYNNFTGKSKYNFIHTLNSSGNPDTLVIDPVLSYDVVAHTIPPVSISNITLNPGKHTIIPIEAIQGKLDVKMSSKIKYQFTVSSSDTDSTLNLQSINDPERYISGIYDIELFTLPRFRLEDVEIFPSQTTECFIPSTGLVNIMLPSKGFGGIYVVNGDSLNQIYHFKGERTDYRLNLLPGKYKVVYRSLSSRESIYTIEKNFTVKSDKSKLIKIY